MVFLIPELATMTFNAGVNIMPKNFDKETHKHMTGYICEM